MRLLAYAVRDNAVQAFMAPVFVRSEGEARRLFVDGVADINSPMNKHYADFALFHVGYWDDSSGKLSSVDGPREVMNGFTVFAQLSAKSGDVVDEVPDKLKSVS